MEPVNCYLRRLFAGGKPIQREEVQTTRTWEIDVAEVGRSEKEVRGRAYPLPSVAAVGSGFTSVGPSAFYFLFGRSSGLNHDRDSPVPAHAALSLCPLKDPAWPLGKNSVD